MANDPYALRRAANGVVRITLENSIKLPLAEIIKRHVAELAGLQDANVKADDEEIKDLEWLVEKYRSGEWIDPSNRLKYEIARIKDPLGLRHIPTWFFVVALIVALVTIGVIVSGSK